MSPIASGLVHMELNRGDGSLGTFLGVQAGLAMQSIAMLGSEEQKQRWLPGMAALDKLGAFALTEPTHGSDSGALETSARRDGDDWVINRQKKWIGNGGVPGSPRVLLALVTPRRYYQPDYYRRIAVRIYGGLARTDPDALLRGSVARFVERPSIRGYLGQLYAITGWTSLPWLHKLPQPTLVLNGDDEPIVPLVNGRILARRIPDARLHVVRGGGHLFLLERPAESADLVAEFLHGKMRIG